MGKWKCVAREFNVGLNAAEKRMTVAWITRHIKEIQLELAKLAASRLQIADEKAEW
jgi:hypothetical protein